MATIREFVNNNLGGKIDYDGAYGHQCVDLIYLYLKEVFGISKDKNKTLGNGKNNVDSLVNKFGFERVKNPKRGDVVSFGATSGNKYGHVAIVLASDDKGIYVLEQNATPGDGFGLGGDAISIRKKTYSNILGYARYKNISEIVELDLFDKFVYEKNIYVWEGNGKAKREDAAVKIFYAMAGEKNSLNGKTHKDLWNGQNGGVNATREEILYMILAFLNKVKGKNYEFSDLQKMGIWNGRNQKSTVTGFEFTIMVGRAMGL